MKSKMLPPVCVTPEMAAFVKGRAETKRWTISEVMREAIDQSPAQLAEVEKTENYSVRLPNIVLSDDQFQKVLTLSAEAGSLSEVVRRAIAATMNQPTES